MDKLDKKNTITIKINNDEKAYINELKKEQKDDVNQEEEKDKQTEMETAAAQEEESFEWILPTKTANKTKNKERVFVPKKTGKQKKLQIQEKKLRSLFIAVFVAVLVGSGFGYVIWQTIVEKVEPASTTAPPVTNNTDEGDAPPPSTDGSLVVPAVTVTVVQAGVFSNQEAAQELQMELRNQNISAAVLPFEDKYYTIISTSDSLENAKAVSVQFRESGMDAYWKEFRFGGDKQVSQTELDSLTASFALYKQLVGDNDVSTVEESLLSLQSNSGENESIAAMIDHLATAVEALKGNENEKNAIIQQQLLQYVVLYNEFARS